MRPAPIDGDIPASASATFPVLHGNIATWASEGVAWFVVTKTDGREDTETVTMLDPLVALHIAGRLAVNAVLAATVHRLRPTWEPAVRLGSRGRRGSCAPAR